MINLRSEQEIIATWKNNFDKPVVSICCLTYNHEKYIEDAIRGFLIQETDFSFEIIIHDDASTDRTSKVIEKYSSAYPRIVKTIMQKDNKYSKGINPGIEYLLPAAIGKYIALCEGDDYWISSDKLMKQIYYMKKYHNVGISFHPAFTIPNQSRKNELICDYGESIKVISNKTVIKGGGGFMPTASIIFQAKFLNTIPKDLWRVAPVGDFYLQIICSKNGAIYIPELRSGYRIQHIGSWSVSQKSREAILSSVNGHYCALSIVHVKMSIGKLNSIQFAFGRYIKKLVKADCFSPQEKIFIAFKYLNMINKFLLVKLMIYIIYRYLKLYYIKHFA